MKHFAFNVVLQSWSTFQTKYEFPGGKIENGETKEGAIIREIKEELHLEIAEPKFSKRSSINTPTST